MGEHPHRGFETVTIVYQGEVEHRDSAGNGGRIGPGDVQWMTAAAGLTHEEFHSQAFTKRGGTMEMAQLWVNLPAKDKMSRPRYQPIVAAQIPIIDIPGGAGRVRVIAGEYGGVRGPAITFTPVNVWDVRLNAASSLALTVPEGHTTLIALLRGSLNVNGTDDVAGPGIVQLDRAGVDVRVEARSEATFLVLTGEPIDEPIAGYGPFVMPLGSGSNGGRACACSAIRYGRAARGKLSSNCTLSYTGSNVRSDRKYRYLPPGSNDGL